MSLTNLKRLNGFIVSRVSRYQGRDFDVRPSRGGAIIRIKISTTFDALLRFAPQFTEPFGVLNDALHLGYFLVAPSASAKHLPDTLCFRVIQVLAQFVDPPED